MGEYRNQRITLAGIESCCVCFVRISFGNDWAGHEPVTKMFGLDSCRNKDTKPIKGQRYEAQPNDQNPADPAAQPLYLVNTRRGGVSGRGPEVSTRVAGPSAPFVQLSFLRIQVPERRYPLYQGPHRGGAVRRMRLKALVSARPLAPVQALPLSLGHARNFVGPF